MPHSLTRSHGPGESLPETGNLLLKRFGAGEASLREAGRPVMYGAGEPIVAAETILKHVLFVDRGLVALHWIDVDGASVEVDAVGPDGAVGLLEALTLSPMTVDARAELATEGLEVPVAAIIRLADDDPAARSRIWRYAIRTETRTRRRVGCLARHGARARLADHLLVRDSLAPRERLPLTQEGLALSLGVYRTTVTALVAELLDSGLVAASRGWITVVDRGGLSRIACGCQSHACAAELRDR